MKHLLSKGRAVQTGGHVYRVYIVVQLGKTHCCQPKIQNKKRRNTLMITSKPMERGEEAKTQQQKTYYKKILHDR
jgi:hypothetical protein